MGPGLPGQQGIREPSWAVAGGAGSPGRCCLCSGHSQRSLCSLWASWRQLSWWRLLTPAGPGQVRALRLTSLLAGLAHAVNFTLLGLPAPPGRTDELRNSEPQSQAAGAVRFRPGPGFSVALITSTWRERAQTVPGPRGCFIISWRFPLFLFTVLPKPFFSSHGGQHEGRARPPVGEVPAPLFPAPAPPSRLRVRLVRGQDRECWEAGRWGKGKAASERPAAEWRRPERPL